MIMYNRAGKNIVWHPTEDLFSKYLWSQAKARVLVDGGTQRWLSWLSSYSIEPSSVLPPDLITGDMDSISPPVLDKFKNNGVTRIIKTPDQDETDFTKSLKELNIHSSIKQLRVDVVYVIADTSGRLDQIIANINTLFKAIKFLPDLKIIQIASNSLSWLLVEGTHTIYIPLELREKQEWCSLIPIHSPSVLTTSGLKWNLENFKCEFGEMVSTSNTYGASDTVTVATDKTILWSMGIEALLER